MMMSSNTSLFHVAMYPWFALGHLTSFLHISNKLAERGHKISFLMPKNTIPRLSHFNLHPHLIFFVPITVPHVDGLPLGSETTSDLPNYSKHSLLMTAMDLTEPVIETCLKHLKPHMVFFDFTHWLPALACKLGIKALHYCTISPATVGYLISPERKLLLEKNSLTEADLINPPPSFPPSSTIRLHPHEARELATAAVKNYGNGGISFVERQLISFASCHAVVFKTCREMEGPYCDYLERQMRKQVFLAGPVLPDTPLRIMSGDLKVGVEVEKSEDGLFTREAVCKVLRAVMDSDSEVGQMVRTNHAKWRKFLFSKGLENSYVDHFNQNLHSLLRS
ncbi:hypothetical protein JHK82_023263 [Glycine max]|nr:hypothetical protein JHK82_023263 [Glycine max]